MQPDNTVTPQKRVYSKTLTVKADTWYEALAEAMRQSEFHKDFFPGHEVRATPWRKITDSGTYTIEVEVYTSARTPSSNEG